MAPAWERACLMKPERSGTKHFNRRLPLGQKGFMKKTSRIVMAFCVAALAFSLTLPTAMAKNNGNGNGKGKNKDVIQLNKGNQVEKGLGGVSGVLSSAGISVSEARNLASLGGFTGYQGLPPGIAKNLGRGKPLPPGIAKRMVPQDMLFKLPEHPGYEWRIAGQDLILVQIGSSIVADVLSGVFN